MVLFLDYQQPKGITLFPNKFSLIQIVLRVLPNGYLLEVLDGRIFFINCLGQQEDVWIR